MYSGDPILNITENGSSIVIKGGQPVMDEGLQNPVTISLFTIPGWFGNIFAKSTTEEIGSDFVSVASASITRTSLVDTQNEAENALLWMIDENAAASIEVIATNPNAKNMQIEERIARPSGEIENLLQTRYGQNWVAQSTDPAYRRI
jgi:phage gp46-like protein